MIEQSKYWPNTAIVIDYDDSDGWYDHQLGPIDLPVERHQRRISTAPANAAPSRLKTPNTRTAADVGPRLPLMVISPWARRNYVDGTFTEQSSVTRFIEENWELGKIGSGSEDATSGTLENMFDFNRSDNRAPAIILNPETGEVEHEIPSSENQIREGKEGKEGQEGAQGPTGPAGTEGKTGPAGSEGPEGKTGPSGPEGKEGKAGPQGPEGSLGTITCTHTGKHYRELEITCVASAKTASVRKPTTAIVTLARNHRIVARGEGPLGSKIALTHRGRLSGRYTMFVEIPGVTTISRVIKL